MVFSLRSNYRYVGNILKMEKSTLENSFRDDFFKISDHVVIKGKKFTFKKLSAMQQFHLTRRLAPIIASFADGVPSGSNIMEAKKSFNLTKIGEEIAKLSDNDADYIISTCLQTVEYRDEEHERDFPIWHRTGGLAYEWIELPDMLTLTWSVILYNLGGFIPAVPSNTKRLGAA